MSFLKCIVGRLQLSKSGVLLMAVLGKVFRLFDELIGGAVCFIPSKLQLLRERIQFELRADSFHTDQNIM
jgi:hypothetical protein